MEIQEEIVEVGVKNVSPNDLPVYAKAGDSGMDVRANISESIVERCRWYDEKLREV